MNQNRTIAVIMGILALVVGVTAFLNRDNFAENTRLNNEAVFEVISKGETVKSYDMSQIAALGEETFEANLKSSGNDPVAHTYKGVLLKDILIDSGLDPEEGGNAIVSAIDGYVVGVSNDKLMADDNVYLAYIRDDVLLGTREEGGDGPYQLIISKDRFSQYWCKYAFSVELTQ